MLLSPLFTLLSTLVTVNNVIERLSLIINKYIYENTSLHTPFISSYFITAQAAFHHCTFSFITAQFVHHCTLKQALPARSLQACYHIHGRPSQVENEAEIFIITILGGKHFLASLGGRNFVSFWGKKF